MIVEYCYRACLDSANYVEINITGVWPNWGSYCGECDSLFAYLKDPDTWLAARKNRAFDQAVFNKIAREQFEEFYDSTLQNGGRIPYCDENYHYKIFAYKGMCTAYCLVENPIDPKYGGTKWVEVPKNCITNYCCRWEQKFCIDRNTNQIVMEETYTSSIPQQCDLYQINVTDCPAGSDRTVTDCIDSCTKP